LLAVRLRRRSTSLPAVMLLVVTAVSFPSGCATTRPVITSAWASKSPIVDGRFSQGEWPESPQITFSVPPYNSSYLNATVYIMNDDSSLYFMVDATGDKSNDRWDENLIVLANTETSTLNATFTWVEFWGSGGKRCPRPSEECYTPAGAIGAVGYGSSPNSRLSHKIYEVSIPLGLVNATAGQQIDFCSPRKPTGTSISYDYSTGRDNSWPDQLLFYVDPETNLYHTDIDTWGILLLAANPVPEFPDSAVLMISVLVLASLVLVIYAPKKRTSESDH